MESLAQNKMVFRLPRNSSEFQPGARADFEVLNALAIFLQKFSPLRKLRASERRNVTSGESAGILTIWICSDSVGAMKNPIQISTTREVKITEEMIGKLVEEFYARVPRTFGRPSC